MNQDIARFNSATAEFGVCGKLVNGSTGLRLALYLKDGFILDTHLKELPLAREKILQRLYSDACDRFVMNDSIEDRNPQTLTALEQVLGQHEFTIEADVLTKFAKSIALGCSQEEALSYRYGLGIEADPTHWYNDTTLELYRATWNAVLLVSRGLTNNPLVSTEAQNFVDIWQEKIAKLPLGHLPDEYRLTVMAVDEELQSLDGKLIFESQEWRIGSTLITAAPDREIRANIARCWAKQNSHALNRTRDLRIMSLRNRQQLQVFI